MKILFSPVFDFDAIYGHRTMAEYVTDSLFHGLRSLLGDDVVDSPRLWHMYRKDKAEDRVRFDRLWGRGFTLYGLLGDDSGVDRSDVPARLAARHYDLVVVTVHCSAADAHQKYRVLDHVRKIAEHYPPHKIAFVDTLDSSSFDYQELRPLAVYFKRELVDRPWAHPVSISIPREKFVSSPRLEKDKDFAACVPGRHSTYVFEHEADYYADYQRSLFGLTTRKGGWDCMRHYEILANGCVPYFSGLEGCPSDSLFLFPKETCARAMRLPGVGEMAVDHSAFDRVAYQDVLYQLFDYARQFLTTEWAAHDFLDTMSRNGK